MGLSYEIFLDGKNYTRVDFVQLPCTPVPSPTPVGPLPTATPTRWPAPTPTPMPQLPAPPPPQPAGWQGRIVEHLKGLTGREYGTIVVRVIGRPVQRAGFAAQRPCAAPHASNKPHELFSVRRDRRSSFGWS